ncbi:hypothetical protein EPN95_02070 [Patescibacteria group bacterium]|nr:MAG: hypothetical protein EPN95_02070 [Patescibacteria group bacterium]
MVKKSYTTAIIILHIVVILLADFSPFWLDWKLVVLGVIAYYLQIAFFGGCVLSQAQFKDKKQSFHEWYLRKLGLKPNQKYLNLTLRYIIPFLLLGLALIFQVLLQFRVITSF